MRTLIKPSLWSIKRLSLWPSGYNTVMHWHCDYYYTSLLIKLTLLNHVLLAVLLSTKTFHPDTIKMDFLFVCAPLVALQPCRTQCLRLRTAALRSSGRWRNKSILPRESTPEQVAGLALCYLSPQQMKMSGLHLCLYHMASYLIWLWLFTHYMAAFPCGF